MRFLLIFRPHYHYSPYNKRHAAIDALPGKQGRRLYAHYILGVPQTEKHGGFFEKYPLTPWRMTVQIGQVSEKGFSSR